MKKVSVSFLKDGSYEKYIEMLNETDCDYIHFDVMDGKFVNNSNLSTLELLELLKISKKKNDVHLMVVDPSLYIDSVSASYVDCITIHYEIDNVEEYIDKIKNLGIKVGIAINPDTAVDDIFKYLDRIDLVLVMGVYPGRSGQEFIMDTSYKIDELRKEIDSRKLSTKISVDGGVCDKVFPYIKNADVVVSASYVLDNLENIEKIKNLS